jgi:hypothetical protein
MLATASGVRPAAAAAPAAASLDQLLEQLGLKEYAKVGAAAAVAGRRMRALMRRGATEL